MATFNGSSDNDNITGTNSVDLSYLMGVADSAAAYVGDILYDISDYVFNQYPSNVTKVTSTAFDAIYYDGTHITLTGSSLTRSTTGNISITAASITDTVGNVLTSKGSIILPIIVEGDYFYLGIPSGKSTENSWTSADGNTFIREKGAIDIAPNPTTGKLVSTTTEFLVSHRNPETGFTQSLTLKGSATETATVPKIPDGFGGTEFDYDNAAFAYTGSFTSLVLNDGQGSTQTYTVSIPYTADLVEAMAEIGGLTAVLEELDFPLLVGGNDTINAGAGDDTITPGSGNNIVDGGVGADTLVLNGLLQDYVFSRPAADTVKIVNITEGVVETHTVKNIESVRFSDNSVHQLTINDLLANTASIFDDAYTGTSGNDTFDGLAGNDTINGNAGDDTLFGGLGNDVINGGAGADTMTGGAGDDTYVVDDYDDIVIELEKGGADTIRTTLDYYSLGATAMSMGNTQIENLSYIGVADFFGYGNALANIITGGNGDDNLYGGRGTAIDTLIGGGGNDFLDGGAGADKMTGGDGDDTYFVDNTADAITELSNTDSGIDTITTSLKTYTLATTALANVENLSTSGYWGESANNSIFTGNAANNTITGSNGLDFNERFGSDTSLASLLGEHAGLASYASAAMMIQDYVFASPSVVSGSPKTTATALDISYEDGTRIQAAGSGFTTTAAHTVKLSSGTVTKAGDFGITEVTTFKGTISQKIDSLGSMDGAPTGKITEATWTSGYMIVSGPNTGKFDDYTKIVQLGSFDLSPQTSGVNLGKLVSTTTSITISQAEDGIVSSITLKGNVSSIYDPGLTTTTYSGNFTSLILNDGLGNTSTWTGTLTYSADVAAAIYDLNNDGSNLFDVFSTSSILGGNDTLNGDAGNDTLYGGAGADLLNGGIGNDTLTGGAGRDKFIFSTTLGSNIDTITDFSHGDDVIQLNKSIFTKISTTGVLNANLISASNGVAAEADDRIVFDSATGNLYYDADGSGAIAQVQFATLTGVSSVTSSDFLVV